MTGPVAFRAKLEEPPVPGDHNSGDAGIVPSFNAYSGDGDVTAPLSTPISACPPITMCSAQRHRREGQNRDRPLRQSFRGTKSKVAQEHGAIGCIIYSDPRDDGYFQGDVYPNGAFRPAGRAARQRSRYYALSRRSAFSRLGLRARREASSAERSADFMKIPVLPISYGDAQPLLRISKVRLLPKPGAARFPSRIISARAQPSFT